MKSGTERTQLVLPILTLLVYKIRGYYIGCKAYPLLAQNIYPAHCWNHICILSIKDWGLFWGFSLVGAGGVLQ